MSLFNTWLASAGRQLRRFHKDDSAATAVEYALVASGVGAAVAATVWNLGSGVKNFYSTLAKVLP